jgi:hypothetical protein
MTGQDGDKDGRKAQDGKGSRERPAHQDQAKSQDRDRDHDPLEGMAYEPAVNQIAHEPMPASRDDDADHLAVRESEEHWRRMHSPARSVRRDAEHGKSGSASQAVPAPRDAPRAGDASRAGDAATDRDEDRRD